MNELTPKERMAIPRQGMPEQDPNLRITNFNEVNHGLTPDLAMEEAKRCLDCKKRNCVAGCPVNVQIPEFIMLVNEGKFLEAAALIKEDNTLPAICGRVCPQEDQCEGVCVLAKKHQPVAIGNLERFVMDYEREYSDPQLPAVAEKTGKKVAIVGSGPAGLSCAGDMIKAGHDVTVFEALHELGGVLTYGIPEFRLPKEIVKEEIGLLADMGVDFQTNAVIGISDTIEELMNEEGYDSVFIAVGAGLPRFLNVDGENLVGVYSANEFLTRVNLMKAYNNNYDTPVFDCTGRTVAVFGGGNTAMDSVRTAKRLGAKNAYIIYRRSEAELPARLEEIHHTKEEQIEFLFLQNPMEFHGNDDGWLTGVKLQRMELGEPDDSGRRRPIPIDGDQYDLDIDMAVIAIGNGSNPIIQKTTPDLAFNKWGNITVEEDTMATNLPGVYAGGDIVTGGATVILAMGAGRKAAAAMNEYLAAL